MSRTDDPREPFEAVPQTFSPRTDLAVEAHELARAAAPNLRGIDESVEELENFRITRVHVRTVEGARAIGKPPGTYITLDVPGIRRRDPALQDEVAAHLAKELQQLIDIPEDGSVLVVGLGNSHVTPDALGPLVMNRLFVTRHLFHYMPEAIGEGYRTVSGVAPGVLGITGIETSEIVQGIVEHVKPDLVVAIDALAARSLSRVNATIQIADTGINPGAGVGNKRKALNRETLGIPVIAVGVPTVVDASTIANDSMELLLGQLRSSVPNNGATKIFDQFSPEEKWQMIREVLEPLGDNLMVTPKEIDEFIDDTAHVVAKGLNLALHPGMTSEDADVLTH
ncbi:GPR endopeptidase [Alicyclobacillus cycloheptanicus]|uniref:Germination protease n=1 Tax=Alicyclobacillus cycloheptanicus TaxID=1457 RepID=A0ABT9XJK2_9BACL|nr:GPR endopeptidase [Alicyclobacillus cycloheptanicus]MDQ0190493.1 spore protease [Alicyclobacillus cycloheptanicus]WDM00745.1 GPR endopeptidase [Alicyclobacillus cycloheptanicus]